MIESMKITALQVISCMPHFGIAMLMLFIGWFLYDKLTPFKFDHELVKNDNPAAGILLMGYFVGLGIGVAGTLFGAEMNLSVGSLQVVASCALVIVLMLISGTITDKVILPKFSIIKEIVQDKNMGTGFVVAGNFIASGLILNGAMTGDSTTFMMAARDVMIYWAIGQILIIIGGLIFQKMTTYDLHKEIGDNNNAAAGLSFGGFQIALGIIMRTAIAGASSNITAEIGTVIVIAGVGFCMLIATRIIADKVLMPSSCLSDEVGRQKNTAAAAIALASFLVVAITLSYAIKEVAMAEANPVMEQLRDASEAQTLTLKETK